MTSFLSSIPDAFLFLLRYYQTILSYYADWRSHDCEGFTESQQGLSHSFTILLDAHPDLNADAVAYLQSKMLSRKGGKLTVASFAAKLNNDIIPSHAGLKSELVDRHGITPTISCTVAWRYMTQLGLKYGALKKGLIQDHERKDVRKVRTGFVKDWVNKEDRMHCWRMVDVEAAKKRLSELPDATLYGNKDELLQILQLDRVKEEAPSDSEMKCMDSWATAYIAADARSIIMNTTQRKIAIHADQFEEALDDDDILGPLCTKEGVYCKWVKEGPYTILRCFKDGKRFKPRKDQRPILVSMHDEAIVRHKDIGRHGWTHRRLASQVYKDDGSGRMLSDYFLCLIGHLLLNKEETEAVNRIRAVRGDPPIRFGTISPTEASGVKLGAWEDEEVGGSQRTSSAQCGTGGRRRGPHPALMAHLYRVFRNPERTRNSAKLMLV